jgi:hypothetical protein
MALLGLWTRITIDIATKVSQLPQDWRNTEAVGCNNRLIRASCDHDETFVVRCKSRALLRSTSVETVGVVVSRPESSPSVWSRGRAGSTPSTCPTPIRLGP